MAAKQGQNSVEPIRDPEQIRAMKEYLLKMDVVPVTYEKITVESV